MSIPTSKEVEEAVKYGQKFLKHLQEIYQRVKAESTKPDYKVYMSPDLQSDLLNQITTLQTLIQAVNPKEEVGVEEIVGWLDDIDIDSAEDFYDRTKVLAKSLLTKFSIRRRG